MTINNDRHPSTVHMLQMLEPNPNLAKGDDLSPSAIAHYFWNVALNMVEGLPDSPELTAGLRKLLEAKDCFVRAAVHKD